MRRRSRTTVRVYPLFSRVSVAIDPCAVYDAPVAFIARQQHSRPHGVRCGFGRVSVSERTSAERSPRALPYNRTMARAPVYRVAELREIERRAHGEPLMERAGLAA